MVEEGEEVSNGGSQLLTAQRKALQFCLDALKSCGELTEDVILEKPWFTKDTFPGPLNTAVSSDLFQSMTTSTNLLSRQEDEDIRVTDSSSQHHHDFLSYLNMNPWNVAARIQHFRDEALQEFICRLNNQSLNDSDTGHLANNNPPPPSCIDVVDWNSSHEMTSLSFKHTYIHRNIPCIIKGLDRNEFANVTSLWTRMSNVDVTDTEDHDRIHTLINTDWFLTQLGGETLVPIRHNFSPTSTTTTQLDPDGRAEECKTTQVSLKSWIHLLHSEKCTTVSSFGSFDDADPNIYLKDWHLQQQWESFHDSLKLYTTPEIFQQDLLNHYLIRFTDGDYKFVYWGPLGSRTNLHSDVMNSFSWSYNVSGKKEWKFYIPDDHISRVGSLSNNNHPQSFTVIQQSGETVLVPAGWKHTVRNLMETISINHNWIVPASLDLTWMCMLNEIQAVEQEMISWGMMDDSYEIRENMLSACFGLNVSSFFLMILVGMIHQMTALGLLPLRKNGNSSFKVLSSDSWECWFDLACMISTMNSMLIGMGTGSENITNVARRLEATLGNTIMASNAIHLYYFLQSICFKNYEA